MEPTVVTLRSLTMNRWTLVVGTMLVAAQGCTYELRGRVIDTGFESVQFIDADDPRSDDGTPVAGARIVLTRDPGALNRADVSSAVASSDGWFTLRVDEFGSGWMEEQWGLRVARSGFGGTEEIISLPFDPKKTVLLISMARGPARPTKDPPQGSELRDDAGRFWQSPGSR